MNSNDYEKFEQREFDELAELERTDRHRTLVEFIQVGKRCGIDVILEIVDKNPPVSKVFDEVRLKLQEK
jgi:hypothetical protein